MKSVLKHIRNILIPYYKHEPKIMDFEINRPIYIFYHIYCGKGNWKSIFDEQIALIKMSGLYNLTNKFFLTIIGTDIEKEYVLSRIQDSKVEIVYFSQDGSCFEFPCLKKMHKLSSTTKFYALYLHTKGSSYCEARFNGDFNKYKLWIDNVSAWRDLMNYYNITKWDMAISSLIEGYSTYGCLLMEEHRGIKPHYSGNFWWTTSENCSQADDLNLNVDDRWNAEQWIINKNSKPYCVFYSYVLLYSYKVQSSTWLKPWWYKENIVYMLNHWKEGRKHLLY